MKYLIFLLIFPGCSSLVTKALAPKKGTTQTILRGVESFAGCYYDTVEVCKDRVETEKSILPFIKPKEVIVPVCKKQKIKLCPGDKGYVRP